MYGNISTNDVMRIILRCVYVVCDGVVVVVVVDDGCHARKRREFT